MIASTQVMRQDTTYCPVLVVRHAVRHYVLVVRGVPGMLTSLAMGRVGLGALPRDLTLRGLVIFTDAAHVQSVLHDNF